MLRAQVDPYEICEHLVRKTVVYTDLSNFTKYSNGTDVSDVYKFVNNMYKGILFNPIYFYSILTLVAAFDHLIPHFAGELVKRTGDGESRPAWDVLGECVNMASR